MGEEVLSFMASTVCPAANKWEKIEAASDRVLGTQQLSPTGITEWNVDAAKSPEPAMRLRAVIVEDDPADAELLLRALRAGGFEPEADVAQTADDFRDRVRK